MEKAELIVNRVHGRALRIDKPIMPSRYTCGCCWKDRVLVDLSKSLYNCECGDIMSYTDFTKDMFGKVITDIGFQSWRCGIHGKHFIVEVRIKDGEYIITTYEEKEYVQSLD